MLSKARILRSLPSQAQRFPQRFHSSLQNVARPKIVEDMKLDFRDVLLLPQFSDIQSRADVDLVRSMTFRNSKAEWTGVPIICSNMDTTGTFEMSVVMGKHRCLTAIHKYYSLEEWRYFAKEEPQALPYVSYSAGISTEDFELAKVLF
mmetsp:Transcript_25143/g.24605  ORF Transcript_25143/g.24605 Transcript_25143/m.24605 type:complete len:148 (+) Transcript_25143:28-471(+)